jgi:hypothetical protein
MEGTQGAVPHVQLYSRVMHKLADGYAKVGEEDQVRRKQAARARTCLPARLLAMPTWRIGPSAECSVADALDQTPNPKPQPELYSQPATPNPANNLATHPPLDPKP